ncbi:MAG: type 1 glutamine amidotransferase domain-containing protein [Phycisphaerae bacterium]|jgi:protease I
MKALILIADGVEDLEFFYPYYRLQEEGIDVEIAGPATEKYTGKYGYQAEAEVSLTSIPKGEYGLLIIPGGKAPESFRLLPGAVDIARKMMEAGKPVAAICHGPQLLISANVLKGRKATCWKGVKDDIIAAGAEYIDEEVVVDGNLITSRSPDDLPAFCGEIFKMLKK